MNRYNETEILLEIALRVGATLDLDEMLRGSVSTMMRLLNCSGGQVFQATLGDDDESLQWTPILSMPRPITHSAAHSAFVEKANLPKTVDLWPEWTNQLPLVEQDGSKTRLLFDLPGFGALVLEKNGEPFDVPFIKSLQLLLGKLGNAAVTCIELAERGLRREKERFDLKFRGLVAEASARFVEVSDSRTFDNAVDGALASLGNLFGVDRSYLFRFSEDLSKMDNTHEWCAPGVTPQKDRIQRFPLDDLRWWKARMLELDPVQIPEVSALPSEAAAEREEFQSQGIKSLVCLPITDDGKDLIGFMGFDAVRASHVWPEEQAAMLQVLAQIIGSAIVRMEAARALAESEKQLDMFFTQSLSGFFFMMLDEPVEWSDTADKEALLDYVMEHQRMTRVNRAMLDQYGAEEEDFIGLTPGDLFAHDPEQGRSIWRGLFDRGRWHVETKEQRLDGTPIIIDGDYICLYDEQGRITGHFGVQTDITERKRAEEEMQHSEARLRGITHSARDAIIMMDPRGMISFWNPAAETILGYRTEEAIGQDLHELLAPERYLEGSRAALPEFARSGRGNAIGKTLELAARRKDGQEITVALSLSAVSIHNKWHAVGMLRDITDSKRAEQELLETNRELETATARANEMAVQAEIASIAKSEFVANMSHEIRTPMNGVIGMTGLLLETELTEEQRRYAEIVRASGESLLGVINDILDFSKIEAGKLDLEILDFDLQGLLEDFASTMALKAHDKGLELICAAEPDVPTLLSGDPGRLRQILTNLAGNAVKFTQKGEVAVRISIQKSGVRSQNEGVETEDSCLLRFSVRDTGIGIPKEKIGLLFRQFAQVDASTTRKYGGTGLGLAISKRLAELMGGEIGVSSIEGEGSEFWFTARFGIQGDKKLEETPSADLSGVRVLIVDDNATSREILSTRLASWGMRPEEAQDGPSGLGALRSALGEGDPFRLAVIDMQMPGMDGEAVGRAVKADGKLADTRLVMLSSLGARGNARRFREIGFSAYAVKPIRHEEFKGVLTQALAEVLKKWLPVSEEPQTVVPDQKPPENEPSGPESCIGQSSTPILDSPAPASESEIPSTIYPVRILLVEDFEDNRLLIHAYLKNTPGHIEVAENGAAALEKFKTGEYDIVLMDIQMPVMDGYEATREIRKWEKKNARKETPIIALTAYSLADDFERSIAAGCTDHLTKPIKKETLLKAIRKHLGG